ncbi:MAG: hypothetical protein KDD44_14735, partial [Bdellovibrionales bacterium]|nr:hypothetical protein [Bdellovibrionales bacterium]
MSERGVVLILVALLTVLLLGVAGLAIDTALLSASHVEQRHHAEYVALGALQAFHRTTGDWNAKLDAAILRAGELAGANRFIGKAFQENATYDEQFDAANTDKGSGTLRPGYWYRTEPEGGCGTVKSSSGCPCSNGSWEGPCFRALNEAESILEGLPVTAMLAEL